MDKNLVANGLASALARDTPTTEAMNQAAYMATLKSCNLLTPTIDGHMYLPCNRLRDF